MALFAFVFMILFRPFNIYDDLPRLEIAGLSAPERFYIAALIMTLGGAGIVALSRAIMNRYNRRRPLTYGDCLVWSLLEFVILALILTLASIVLFHTNFIHVFPRILLKVFGVMSIPYGYSIIYMMLLEHIQLFNKLRRQIEHDEIVQQKAYVLFHDDKGLRLSVKRDDLVMIESADNYVCVWYLSSGGVKREMVRNTLKRLAEEMRNGNIRRCHRSYMVNLERVKVMRREKDGIFIEFGIAGVPDIPISKTYAESITAWRMK